MILESIRFLKDSEGGVTLLTRINVELESPVLNWERHTSKTHADSTAFLIRSIAERNPLRLEVKVTNTESSKVEIRASNGAGLDFGTATLEPGESSFHLEAPANALFEKGVQILNLDFEWQYRVISENWQPLGITKHRFYLAPEMPAAPWEQEEGSHLPWIEALEIACEWAKGAQNLRQASTNITQGLNQCRRFAYDISSGASNYTTPFDEFLLSDFLARVNGEEANGKLVNCTDCATIVSTLANLLGAELVQGRMGKKFDVHPIQAIGYADWDEPFSGSFSYHEVAWEDSISAEGYIYDACLRVDENQQEDPDDRESLLPVYLQMGTQEDSEEYLRLLTPNTDEGAGSCEAMERSSINRPLYD